MNITNAQLRGSLGRSEVRHPRTLCITAGQFPHSPGRAAQQHPPVCVGDHDRGTEDRLRGGPQLLLCAEGPACAAQDQHRQARRVEPLDVLEPVGEAASSFSSSAMWRRSDEVFSVIGVMTTSTPSSRSRAARR